MKTLLKKDHVETTEVPILKTLLLLLLLSLAFTSCTDQIEEAIADQEQESAQADEDDDELDDGDFDERYAETMEQSFGNRVDRGDDCYHMYGQNEYSDFRLPPRRPMRGGGGQSYQNKYGMGIDGSRIDRTQNGSWQFESSPYSMIQYGYGSQLVGVHKDGAPIYAQYENDGDQEQLDEYGGIYSPTDEFPEGIYHYVITLRIEI